MERLIRSIVLEHRNKRIRLAEIESALKERGINLFADQSKHHKFIETIDNFIARGILESLKYSRQTGDRTAGRRHTVLPFYNSLTEG